MTGHHDGPPAGDVLLRAARADDEPALLRLAALDSAGPLTGPALVAEQDRTVVAALCLSTDRVVADPFVPTRDLVGLLRRDAARRRAPSPARQRRLLPRSVMRAVSAER